MPFPLIEVRVAEADAASAKVALAQTAMVRLLVQAVVGGALVAAAVVVMLLAVAEVGDAGSRLDAPVRGIMLGLGLAVSVAVGAELFPSTAVTMVRAVLRRGVDIGDATLVVLTSLLGNLVGAITVGGAVDAVGAVRGGASPEQRALGALAVDLVDLGRVELFALSLLCSLVLTVGLLLAATLPSPRHRLLLTWAAAGTATTIGVNLSVVGAALLSLGALSDVAVWSDVSRHLAVTVPANLLAAALVVGIAALVQPTTRVAPRPVVADPTAPAPAAPEEVLPNEVAPREVAPKNTAPEKAAPRDAVPRKAVPRQAASRNAVAKKAVAKKAAPRKAIAKKAAPKTAVAKKAVAKKSAPERAAPRRAAPRRVASKQAASKQAASKQAAPEKSTGAPARARLTGAR